MNYRKDIDGLRAVAVLAVIANHLPGAYLSSGFLGVDVFFVISGFVITASLFQQQPASLSEFYTAFFSRRVKRLLPALFLLVGLTSLYVLMHDAFPEESIATGVAALFGLSNIFLYFEQLDYFAASSKFNAFTHTWSLGVEEQFYLLFPLLIWLGLLKGNRTGSRKRFSVLVAALSIASLIAFVLLYRVNQPAAFFLTPMRIWELGAGVLAYVYSTSRFYPGVEGALGKLSPILLLLLLGVFLAPLDFAVASTIAAVALTFCLLLSPEQALAGRILAIPAAVFIGQISYSLYLWHWPVITQKAFGLTRFSDGWPVYVALMLMLACLSYYCVERPLRRRQWSPRKGLEIARGFAVGAVLAAVILGGEWAYNSRDAANPSARYPANFLPTLSNGKPFNATCVIAANKFYYKDSMYTDCTTFPEVASKPMLWAMGDSHIGHLQGMLYSLHDTFGTGVHLTATNAVQFPLPNSERVNTQASEARRALFARAMDDVKPGDVFLVTRQFFAPEFPGAPVNPQIYPWLEQVSELAESLASKHVQVVLLGPLPFFKKIEHVKACSQVDINDCAEQRDALVTKNRPIMEALQTLARQHDNVHVSDPFPVLCPTDQTWCYPEAEGVFVFRDRGHLNAFGSQKLAEPFASFLIDTGLLQH